MSPIYHTKEDRGLQTIFETGQDGIQWLGLDLLRLEPGGQWQGELGAQEAALIILSGQADIEVDAGEPLSWQDLGGRPDPFTGPGTSVYAPRGSKLGVTAHSPLEVAIAKSPCEQDLPPQLIEPSDVKVVSSGALNWHRDVRLIIPPGSPISQRMIVGETLNPPGNWSGIPPHKHDVVTEDENFLEEFYLFKSQPADGYGLQLMYVNGEGSGHLVRDGSVTVMLEGYHPTVSSPGTTLLYLWVLAGESKAYDIRIDPRFEWVAEAEAAEKAKGG